MDYKFLDHVMFLGFSLDDELLFSRQISSVTYAWHYMLRKSYSTRDTAIMCCSKCFVFDHRLVHHPQRFLVYLSSLVSCNDEVTKCQYVYNLQVSVLKADFGKTVFNRAIPLEWKRLPIELKLIPDKLTYKKTLKTLVWMFFVVTLLII